MAIVTAVKCDAGPTKRNQSTCVPSVGKLGGYGPATTTPTLFAFASPHIHSKRNMPRWKSLLPERAANWVPL